MNRTARVVAFFSGVPGRTRTYDHGGISSALYQLSYGHKRYTHRTVSLLYRKWCRFSSAGCRECFSMPMTDKNWVQQVRETSSTLDLEERVSPGATLRACACSRKPKTSCAVGSGGAVNSCALKPRYARIGLTPRM